MAMHLDFVTVLVVLSIEMIVLSIYKICILITPESPYESAPCTPDRRPAMASGNAPLADRKMHRFPSPVPFAIM